MRFFWVKDETDPAGEASWAMPFSDMMSLLLAVFVMIAAMSELRNDRFDVVGSAVRSGFGFSLTASPAGAMAGSQQGVSLIDRLRQAGLDAGERAASNPLDPELSACCQVVTLKDRLVIQVDGAVAFERFAAQLLPQARILVARIGSFLEHERVRLEVRGHGGDGPLPPQATFRDAIDLSYARARSVADLLVASGVAAERVFVTACGDQEPLANAARDAGSAANRRIEIIVHVGKPAGHALNIAEKERAENG